MAKPQQVLVVTTCSGCPFLDRDSRGDLCNYCGLVGLEINWSLMYHQMPSACPLREKDYIVRTDKKPRKKG